MKANRHCPCDEPPYICPYDAENGMDCLEWCGLGADEPSDNPGIWED